jgi:chemosensory pili system protein ChpA (sensor histidine kinase/response regulator)
VQVIATLGDDGRRGGPEAETALIEDRWLPLIRLDRALGLPSAAAGDRPPVLGLRGGGGPFACQVDQVLHVEEIVVKPLGGFLDGVGPYSGATVSADGRVTLLLDAASLGQLVLRPSPGARGAPGVASSLGKPLALDGPPGALRAPSVGVAGRGVGKKGRVLLVDDSLSVRKFVGAMLSKAGFVVTTANDGADALARLAEAEFDVLVTDLEMPRLNGYELLEDVRRRPSTRALPVVILTTRAGDKHQSLARRLGVNHYMTKPVAEEAFVRLVESLAAGGVERTP